MIEWRILTEDFKPDGALRDIYVRDATLADWQATLGHIRERYAPLQFKIDGHLADLPRQVAELATVVGKPALLTMENMPGEVILRADPTSGIVVARKPS